MRSTLVISFLKHASIYNRPSSVQFFVQRQPSKELQRSLLRIARHKRRAELTEIMASTAPADYSERWETMWSKGLKPGEAFDATTSSPALLHLLDARHLVDVHGKTCFVPGCGRGYDLVSLIKAGATTAVGLELAPSAIPPAIDEVKNQLGEEATKTSVIQGDFFKWSSPDGGFDIGFDYTFLCALHPEMRQDWAKAWALHLAPGGKLITLIFPIEEDGRIGPPWPVQPKLYEDLLLPLGFKLVHMEAVPEEQSHPGRGGRENIAVWEAPSQTNKL